MDKSEIVIELRIRAIARDKFTVRTTYADNRTTGQLVTAEKLLEIVNQLVISYE